jgi:hypothetical protein
MTARPPGTPPKMVHLQIGLLRQMPSWRKMALMAGMGQTVQNLALSGLRQRYPCDTTAQRHRRLANLLLGPELAARAYCPLSEEG